MCPQVSSQLPQMAATWSAPCSQPSEGRKWRLFSPCPTAASRGSTRRVSFLMRRLRWQPHHISSATAAARPSSAWSSPWSEETEPDSWWRQGSSPSQPPPLGPCRLSVLCFCTPAHRNDSPATQVIPYISHMGRRVCVTVDDANYDVGKKSFFQQWKEEQMQPAKRLFRSSVLIYNVFILIMILII